MSVSEPWRPACTLETLHVRATMLRTAREFFFERGYLEVETPCLSRDIVIDAWLEPIEVRQNSQRWFLQTSPEAFMKRLLSAGSGSIFQISRVFRSGEIGVRHNPEFTMLEWYGVGSSWEEQAELTESLVRCCMQAAAGLGAKGANDCIDRQWSDQPFRRTTYAEAFRRVFNIDVHQANVSDLKIVCQQHHVPIADPHLPGGPTNEELQKDDLLNAMLAFSIEPSLGRTSPNGSSSPEFLCDYPGSQAALAMISEEPPYVARRFELYINGLELCNGYQELTDVAELQQRERRQNSVRAVSQLAELPGASHLAAAMKAGLPKCSGVALGFDRLVMIAAAATSISEVIAFPSDRS